MAILMYYLLIGMSSTKKSMGWKVILPLFKTSGTSVFRNYKWVSTFTITTLTGKIYCFPILAHFKSI